MRSALVLAVLVVLSGCGAPMASVDDGTAAEPDLGVVQGYAYDDELDVDERQGLTEAELEAVTYRAMARIEVIRGLPFEEDVAVSVVTREEVRDRWERDEPADEFTNEFWRGTFLVDEDVDANDAFSDLYGDAVVGFYSDGEIVLVVDDPDEIVVDRHTLVHELVHALQDQHFSLARTGETWDAGLAEGGLIEGEANYVPTLYEQRCDDEWECLEYPPPVADDGETDEPIEERPMNVGLFLSIFVQYTEGTTFVAHLHETQGWEDVDAAFAERPESSSQLIHPDRYPDEGPVDVTVPDRSDGSWSPMTDGEGDVRTETVGEATLFATLWKHGVIDRPLEAGATDPSPYNYSHPSTDGWAGDEFVAYDRADGETGHVWTIAWRSSEDAEAFASAYQELLATHDAVAVEDGVYEIESAPFAGAYRVHVEDETVQIVRAPTVADLEAIHATDDAPLAQAASMTAAPSPPATVGTHSPLEASGGGGVVPSP